MPETIGNLYDSVGWDENGHRKFVTILFGSIYIATEEQVNAFNLIINEYTDLKETSMYKNIENVIRLLNVFLEINRQIFNEHDLQIIRTDMALVERNEYLFDSLRRR